MVRVALAALLVLQPVVQAAELAPVEHLLTRVVPEDEAALSVPGPEKGERLAKLQSDLSLVAEGLEGFSSEADAAPSLKRLRESVEAPEPFKDRASALDAAYRALAVVDYTWAKRLPDAACSPEAARARLLKSGALSSWIAALLGPEAAGGDAASKLDQASAAKTVSVREYALLRAKIHKTTEALGSDKAIGAQRAALYCLRAATYEALSSANLTSAGPVAASRATAAEDASGVYVLARKTEAGLELLGAATAVEGALLTDARLVGGADLVVLRRGGKTVIPVRVERRDPSGLALLRSEETVIGYVLAENAPAKDDLIEAIGHPERTGAWTRTRGLVTSSDAQTFQTDAVIDVGMTGGAALTEDGRLAGVFVLRPSRSGADAFDWPVAVSAPALKSWLEGGQLTVASAPIEIAESGTASILTASLPLGASLVPGALATDAAYEFDTQTPYGVVHAVCAANCDDEAPARRARPRAMSYTNPRSSYGSNANAELGKALGEAIAPLVEAMIFQGIPALFRGIGSLFKSKPKSGVSSNSTGKEPKKIEKPAPPPKPELRITVSSDKDAVSGEVLFTAKVSGNRPDVRIAGLQIAFKLNNAYEASSKTDASGTAVLTVKPAPSIAAQKGLDDESSKHPWLTNTGRTTAAENACVIVLAGTVGALMLSVTIASAPSGVGGVLVATTCLEMAGPALESAVLTCVALKGVEHVAKSPPFVRSAPVGPVSDLTSKTKVLSAAEESQDKLAAEERKIVAKEVAGGQPADPNEPPGEDDPTEEGRSGKWGRAEEERDHFERHGNDFSAKTPREYTLKANDFLTRGKHAQLPRKIDSNGIQRIYDPETNTFGSYNADGSIRTFFKPTGGMKYWITQPGVLQ